MSRTRVIALSVLVAVSLALAFPLQAASRITCVQYVKQASTFALSGDAWRWWDNARGKYQRGNRPRSGAVLVFKNAGKLRHGHVALVSKIIDERTIAVDHANWAPSGGKKGMVQKNVRVRDVSPNNDWTRVRVWYDPAGAYGSNYHTYGFIYRID